jgi:hypothetical protein
MGEQRVEPRFAALLATDVAKIWTRPRGSHDHRFR